MLDTGCWILDARCMYKVQLYTLIKWKGKKEKKDDKNITPIEIMVVHSHSHSFIRKEICRAELLFLFSSVTFVAVSSEVGR